MSDLAALARIVAYAALLGLLVALGGDVVNRLGEAIRGG